MLISKTQEETQPDDEVLDDFFSIMLASPRQIYTVSALEHRWKSTNHTSLSKERKDLLESKILESKLVEKHPRGSSYDTPFRLTSSGHLQLVETGSYLKYLESTKSNRKDTQAEVVKDQDNNEKNAELVDSILKALISNKGNSPKEIATSIQKGIDAVKFVMDQLSVNHKDWFTQTKGYGDDHYNLIVNPSYRSSISQFLNEGGYTAKYVQALEKANEENEVSVLKKQIATLQNSLVNANSTQSQNWNLKDIFVVHGHNQHIKSEVARMLEKLDLNPIILHEKPNKGRTIIEKFEHHSDVGFAIILLTDDDLGRSKTESKMKPRARQNVILEMGYFFGKLGRDRVCPLYMKGVELPSDLLGLVYTEFDSAGAWKSKLVQELQAAGFDADANKLFSNG